MMRATAIVTLSAAILFAGCLGGETKAASKDLLESVENEGLEPNAEVLGTVLAETPTWRVGDNWVYLTRSWNARGDVAESYHRDLVTGTNVVRDTRVVYELTRFSGESATGPWSFAQMRYVDMVTLEDVSGTALIGHLQYPLVDEASWIAVGETYRVRGTTTAFVPAGEFSAVRVEYGEAGDLIPAGEVDFAKSVRNVVRAEHRGSDGFAVARVLVSYHLAA